MRTNYEPPHYVAFSSHFLPLSSKYYHQHPVLKHPQPHLNILDVRTPNISTNILQTVEVFLKRVVACNELVFIRSTFPSYNVLVLRNRSSCNKVAFMNKKRFSCSMLSLLRYYFCIVPFSGRIGLLEGAQFELRKLAMVFPY